MESDRAVQELRVIRQLMERPVRYSTMSGLSGVLAGCAALVGVGASRLVCVNGRADQAMDIALGIWAGVFVVAFLGATILTRIRERRQSMPFWSNVKKRILLTVLPSFAGGLGLTAAIACRWQGGEATEWGLIPAIWMLFYGVALWQVGDFSVPEVRIMGAAFIVAGLVAAALFQDQPSLTLAAAFGGFHIVYGIVVWARHGG